MTAEITRRLEFDYGHRLVDHEGKCASLHGHRGVVEITATAQTLDKVGRVIDFGVLKQVVGGWLDQHWDHAMLLRDDDMALKALSFQPPFDFANIFGPRPPFVLKVNPSAEHLSEIILNVAAVLLDGYPIGVQQVVFYETPNCSARAVWHPMKDVVDTRRELEDQIVDTSLVKSPNSTR